MQGVFQKPKLIIVSYSDCATFKLNEKTFQVHLAIANNQYAFSVVIIDYTLR
jgi:hypothetical protein